MCMSITSTCITDGKLHIWLHSESNCHTVAVAPSVGFWKSTNESLSLSTWPVRFCGRSIAVTPSSPWVLQNAGAAVHLKFRSLMLNFWKVTFTAASHMNTAAEPGCISSAAPWVNRLPAASSACCGGDWRKSRQRGRNSKRGWRKVAWNNCFLRCI